MEWIQRLLDLEEHFLTLKIELIGGNPGEYIDREAALGTLQDMKIALHEIERDLER